MGDCALQASGCQEACNCAGCAAVCPAAVILPVLCGGLSPQQHPEGLPAAEATQRLAEVTPPLREAHRRTEEVVASRSANAVLCTCSLVLVQTVPIISLGRAVVHTALTAHFKTDLSPALRR